MKSIILFVSTMIIISLSACQKEDCQGLREPVNTNCTTEFDPVCGCDGNTYSNSCEAEALGLTSYRAGRCL